MNVSLVDCAMQDFSVKGYVCVGGQWMSLTHDLSWSMLRSHTQWATH